MELSYGTDDWTLNWDCYKKMGVHCLLEWLFYTRNLPFAIVASFFHCW